MGAEAETLGEELERVKRQRGGEGGLDLNGEAETPGAEAGGADLALLPLGLV